MAGGLQVAGHIEAPPAPSGRIWWWSEIWIINMQSHHACAWIIHIISKGSTWHLESSHLDQKSDSCTTARYYAPVQMFSARMVHPVNLWGCTQSNMCCSTNHAIHPPVHNCQLGESTTIFHIVFLLTDCPTRYWESAYFHL